MLGFQEGWKREKTGRPAMFAIFQPSNLPKGPEDEKPEFNIETYSNIDHD